MKKRDGIKLGIVVKERKTWIVLLLIVAVVVIAIGAITIGKTRRKDSEKNTALAEENRKSAEKEKESSKTEETEENQLAHKAYLKMVKEHSYPELKSKLEMDVGLPYVNIKNDMVVDGTKKTHMLHMKTLDIDQDGTDEFLLEVCNVYQSQSLISIYSYQNKKVCFVDAITAYPEQNQFFQKPFDEVGDQEPVLWYNSELKSIYAVSYYDLIDKDRMEEFCSAVFEKKEMKKRYLVCYEASKESKKQFQIGEESQKMVSEEEYNEYREKYFPNLGQAVVFDSYETFIGNYDK